MDATNKSENHADRHELVTLKDLCKTLSISEATGNNWIKLGKFIPSRKINKTLLFSSEYVEKMQHDIKNGDKNFLKNRRNKKYVTGNELYDSYVSNESKNLLAIKNIIFSAKKNQIELTEEIIRSVLAECAIQLILKKNNNEKNPGSLSKYLQKQLPENNCWFLIDDLLDKFPFTEKILTNFPDLFSQVFIYDKFEDTLGLLYSSLKNIGDRKKTGSYYTPTKVIQKLCHNLFSMNDFLEKSIFDPCCGTGNFILQLPKDIDFEHVYGNDVDPISVNITRLNYALKFNVCDKNIIYSHITEKDFLSFGMDKKFDFIIGNPPWGYNFSDIQKNNLRKKYLSVSGNSIESYDVFIEQALTNLKDNGVLSFVLPEAVLNVKSHEPIRKIIINHSNFQHLDFLGDVFDKVQCPSIILQLISNKKTFGKIDLKVNDGVRNYIISKDRMSDSEHINFYATNDKYDILEKINHVENKITLLGNARFALGIVTGDNKKYITEEETSNSEIILKGSDLCKFKIKTPKNYIVFKPELFQQVAPVEIYRAREKLLYRFICNQLVFSYDKNQTLPLNSCNVVIPDILDLDIKYIMAILNSRTAQFYFEKQFHSIKILRSHIEKIPIPRIKKFEQKKFIDDVNLIIKSDNNEFVKKIYDDLDKKIAKLYNLNDEEFDLIKKSLEGKNLFLF